MRNDPEEGLPEKDIPDSTEILKKDSISTDQMKNTCHKGSILIANQKESQTSKVSVKRT